VKIVALSTVLVIAAQCAVALPAYSADLSVAGVVLQDNRPDERKKNYRGGVMSPMIALGDDTLKPAGLVRFQEALKKTLAADAPINLVVNDFAVIDFFPRRMGAIANGQGLVGALVKERIDARTDWTMVENLGLPPDGEAIICLFSGEINGKPATVATFSTYKSGGAASIRNGQPFKEAVTLAIDKAVQQALDGGAEPVE
jgi:hypothetical protein